MKTALVVVDVQSYFLRDAPVGLPSGIAGHIKDSNYDAIVFTIFKNENGSNWERSLHWSRCKRSADTKLPPEFEEFVASNVFTKTAYSAFKGEGFEAYLRQRNIEKLVICGIDLEDCVLATAFEAFDKGYTVNVLFELSYTRNRSDEFIKPIILRDLQARYDPGSH